MTKRDADVRLRMLLDEHRRAVTRCLAYYGVATADQQDIAQEVFLSAHSQLLRDNHPSVDALAVVWRSWLRQIARRQAANYLAPPEAPKAATAIRPLPAVAHPLSAPERRAPDPSDDEHLLDQAQAALNAGDAHAVLAALSKRDGHFGGGPSASVRQRLLVRACALAGARTDPECAGATLVAP